MKRRFRFVATQDTRPSSPTWHPPDPLWVITLISLVGTGNEGKKGSLQVLRALFLFSAVQVLVHVCTGSRSLPAPVCGSTVHSVFLSLLALFQLFHTQVVTGAARVRNLGDRAYISLDRVWNLFLRKCFLRRKQKTLGRKQILNRKQWLFNFNTQQLSYFVPEVDGLPPRSIFNCLLATYSRENLYQELAASETQSRHRQ